MSFDSYNVWLWSIIGITVVIIFSFFAFVLYSYLVSRMPKAVWFKNLEQRLLELEGKVHAEKEALTILSEQNDKQKKLAADLQDLTNRLTTQKNAAEAWLEEHKEDVAKIEVWKKEIAVLADQLGKLEKKLLEDQQKRENAIREASEADAKHQVLSAKVAELKSSEATIIANIDALKKEHEELRTKLAEIKTTIAEETVRLGTLKNELDRLEKAFDAAQEKLEAASKEKHDAENTLQEALARRKGVENEILAWQKTLESLGSMVANMEAQVQNFKPPQISERLEDFHRPLLKAPEEYYLYEESEQGMLEDFQDALLESGYIFHERTIHSFHTSLKIADIAPLVVLAGISGTGKSQLPRLYAKYMGINFLNVSVQPRWDAPEDLFGFYNYMEHRYKATELARALRQMDSKFHPSENNSTGIVVQDGMLLVLLDEMNLARVEYYFSELLSKLEMRSRAQLDDDKMYERSAIQVQAGSLKEGDEEQNQPLFVGYNVLFVGTMNEDETTQALSDKVLDRANVLRFGKPSECRPGKIEERAENTGYILHRDTWNEWVVPATQGTDAAYVQERLNKINDALQTVGRAYGYRIHQSIEQYVANYPGWVDNRLEKAFTDQLEQKILPKLRGLSRDMDDGLENVFNVIGDIITELNDHVLEEAFTIARDKPVFDFKGVSREA